MRIVFFVTLSIASSCAFVACGGDPATTTSSSSGGDGGSTPTPDLGLGAPICAPALGNQLNAELCTTGKACTAAADCAAVPSAECTLNLGTGTLDFPIAGCVGGLCAYHTISGSCEDGTSCEECSNTAKANACSSQATPAACAECCIMRYAAEDYTSVYSACACGANGPCATACSASVLCGGAGPESDACVACLQSALTGTGACVASEAFQAACVGEQNSVFCKKTAQCLVGCPAGGS